MTGTFFSEQSILEVFDFLFTFSCEGVAILDNEGLIVRHNPAFAVLLQGKGTFIGTKFSYVIEQYAAGCGEENSIDIEYNGRKLAVRERIIASQSPCYRIMLISDYDYMKKCVEINAEKSLYRAMYEEILDVVEEGIHAVDKTGKLIIYNQAMEKIEGCKSAAVIGKHATEVYNLDFHSSLLLKVLEDGKPILDCHQKYTVSNGKNMDVFTSILPVTIKGEISGSVAIVRDYTVVKQMAEKIIDLQEELYTKTIEPNAIQACHHMFKTINIIGNNQHLMDSVKLAVIAANSVSPALIYGETGTGKELFARILHYEGGRADNPFLALNCAAIPETLLESMLFGTVKGAFTGAVDRVGLLEQASGGTLYLDELNSMPMNLQAKLLRVLEDKQVRRLGAKNEAAIDTRIVSSFNVEPAEAVEKGQIRDDLLYRLAVFYIIIPPLRERMDDIELLSTHFVQFYNKQLYKNVKGISPMVLNSFQQYNWPGNVRQLKHILECAMNIVTPTDEWIEPRHIPKYFGTLPINQQSCGMEQVAASNLLQEIRDKEKDEIIQFLKKHRGNIAKAAADLGISRQCLQYRIKKHKL